MPYRSLRPRLVVGQLVGHGGDIDKWQATTDKRTGVLECVDDEFGPRFVYPCSVR